MDFHVGDPVIHWSYGLGEIVGLEERAITSQKMLYYVVRVQNLTVYVPADGKAESRLRPPTPGGEFEKLFDILKGSGETLSEDRLERKNRLHKEMADGKVETVCRVIRDLSSLSQKKALNDDDKNVLKQAWGSLCSEWGFSLSLPLNQVDTQLRNLLHPAENAVA